MEREICFTKFKTVKLDNLELTNKMFFDKMNTLIHQNVGSYSVNYESTNDTYKIVYDGCELSVKYGYDDLTNDCRDKDLLDELDKLVTLSDKLKSLEKEVEEKTQHDENEMKKLYREINENVAKTYQERLVLLDKYKKEYRKNKTDLTKDCASFFEEANDGNNFDGMARFMIGLIGGFIFALLIPVWAPLLWFTAAFAAAFIDGVLTALFFDMFFDWSGILMFLLSLLGLLVVLVRNSFKKLGERIKFNEKTASLRREIKNDIKLMKKNKTKDYVPKKKVNINEINKIFDKAKETNLNEEYNLNEIMEVINKLKENVLLIKDDKLNKKYAQDLYEIIKYYIEASSNGLGIKNKNDINKNLLDQIKELKLRVDEELRKEENQNKTNDECNEMMESISYQKSIGTR